MSWQVQIATWTSNNRYPGIFRTIQKRILDKVGDDLGGNKLKILSFGCSNGSEITSLISYFPEALIYGCDINLAALAAARDSLFMDEAIVFESRPSNIQDFGPFDIILAMSVFCRFPESMNARMTDFNALYRYDYFEKTINLLADNLKPAGILCLYNTNYSLHQLPVMAQFQSVRSPLFASSGFVDRFDRDGQRLTWCEQIGPYYVHRIQRTEGLDPATDFVNCIFEKGETGGPDIEVKFGRECIIDANQPPDIYRFGPDLYRCARDRLVASGLAYWFRDLDGGQEIVRAWRRTTPSGTIRQEKCWAVSSDIRAREFLSAEPRVDFPFSVQPSTLNRAVSKIRSTARRVQRRLTQRM